MEASSYPVSPLSDEDKKVMDVMKKLGWGLSVLRLSEATGLEAKDVRFSLDWLERSGLVTHTFNKTQKCTFWTIVDGRTCSICGMKFKNQQGLAIHKARAHSAGNKKGQVWVDRSGPESVAQAESDMMTMDLNLRSIDFVQDLISKFATLPGAKISVTVEFSRGVDA